MCEESVTFLLECNMCVRPLAVQPGGSDSKAHTRTHREARAHTED
jgi:hypothetical protein